MTTWFVSRHQASIEWAKKERIHADHWVGHLDPDAVMAGDTVIGTLPIQMVHELNRRGIAYVHLTLNIPQEWRGQELTEGELEFCEVGLQKFIVIEDELSRPRLREKGEVVRDAGHVHVTIASGEQMQNYLAVMQLKPQCVYVLTSKAAPIQQNALVFSEVMARHGIDCKIIGGFPSDDIKAQRLYCIQVMASIQADHPHAHISVNMTSGNKLMSYALLKSIDPDRGSEVIYVNGEANEICFVEPMEKAVIPISATTSIADWLNLHGIIINSDGKDTSVAIDARGQLTEELKKIFYKRPDMASAMSAQLITVLVQIGYAADDAPVSASIDLKGFLKPLLSVFGKADRLGMGRLEDEVFHLDKAGAVKYFGGGWLEEWTYLQLRSMALDEVVHNTVCRYDERVSISDELKKAIHTSARKLDIEFDVMALSMSRLLLVECKTVNWQAARKKAQAGVTNGSSGQGVPVKAEKFQSDIHRLAALRRKLGRMTVPLLVTLHSPSADDLRKAKAQGITVISGEKLSYFPEQVRELLSRSVI